MPCSNVKKQMPSIVGFDMAIKFQIAFYSAMLVLMRYELAIARST